MIPYVVDASVAIKWFVEEEHAVAARRVLADGYTLSAPDLVWLACGNILWKKIQHGELTAQEVHPADSGARGLLKICAEGLAMSMA